jgi:hypothetical protein
MRIDKSNPLLYSKLCESRMGNESIFESMTPYTSLASKNHSQTALTQGVWDRTVKTESPPTLREWLRNLIGRITYLLMGSQR